jgi:hypothetical protein
MGWGPVKPIDSRMVKGAAPRCAIRPLHPAGEERPAINPREAFRKNRYGKLWFHNFFMH